MYIYFIHIEGCAKKSYPTKTNMQCVRGAGSCFLECIALQKFGEYERGFFSVCASVSLDRMVHLCYLFKLGRVIYELTRRERAFFFI